MTLPTPRLLQYFQASVTSCQLQRGDLIRHDNFFLPTSLVANIGDYTDRRRRLGFLEKNKA